MNGKKVYGLNLKIWQGKDGRWYASARLPTPSGAVYFFSGQVSTVGDVEDPTDQRARVSATAIHNAAAFAKSPAGKALVPAPARALVVSADWVRRQRAKAAQGDREAARNLRALDTREPVLVGALKVADAMAPRHRCR